MFKSVYPRLPARDLRATVAFYEDVLGFKATLLWPEGELHFTILRRGSAEVHFLGPAPDAHADRAATPGDAEVVFEVEDARALHTELAPKVAVEWGPEVYWYGRREFAVRDPNRYLVIFTESTDDPPTC